MMIFGQWMIIHCQKLLKMKLKPKPKLTPPTSLLPDKVVATYGELGGQLHMVEFERGDNGLGVSLAGNRDLGTMSVFVVGIQPESPTANDGRMRVGDQLLEVRDLADRG